MEPRELTIGAAARELDAGNLSAVELMQSVLDQVERHDKTINSYITVRPPDELLKEARRADEKRATIQARPPLDGIPVALKDNFTTAGLRTTAGSKILANWTPDHDATVVSKLRDDGALIVGKLNMHEFANGPTNDNPHYGRVLNPWDVGRTPGGSSGGSGAALAADMCLGATGSDTGGSIRTPAAFCGIVGLKPTYGLVSRDGVVPFSWSLDHVGPMGRTCRDVAVLLQAMAGHDPGDPASVQASGVNYVASVDAGVEGIVLGVETTYFSRLMQPGVRRAFEYALSQLAEVGAKVEEVAIPSVNAALAAEVAILFPEAAAFHRKHLDERHQDYGEDVRRSLLSGRLYSAVDYVQAQRMRAVLKRELTRVFESVDVLATPTVIIEPPEWETARFLVENEELDELNAFIRCTAPFNLAGNPALSVPCGFGEQGLPVGLQLVGRPFADAEVLRAGQALETALGTGQRKPPLTPLQRTDGPLKSRSTSGNEDRRTDQG
jgi:aspartyl-tRNA(Asn)/glutamyl-tRNA(Gln) amidotransferase subunit A